MTDRVEEEQVSPEVDNKDKGNENQNSFISYITNKIRNLFGVSAGVTDGTKSRKILESADLEGVCKFILSGKCKNIITMAGAGISTSAGIPDFRSPGSGLYDNLSQYNLPHPMAIFDISYFKQNPEPFFVLAKNLIPTKYEPTYCHKFLYMLQKRGLLLRHYTQNVDTLERAAGLKEDKLVEAHGSFHKGHCIKCRAVYYREWMEETIMRDTVPKCTAKNCTGVVKPDVIFFGESLPLRVFRLIPWDFPRCDLLIILGTSLVVQPFASLADKVSSKTPRLYINLEAPPDGSIGGGGLFGGNLNFNYRNSKNNRDVFWQGTCDDGCKALVKALSWEEESAID